MRPLNLACAPEHHVGLGAVLISGCGKHANFAAGYGHVIHGAHILQAADILELSSAAQQRSDALLPGLAATFREVTAGQHHFAAGQCHAAAPFQRIRRRVNGGSRVPPLFKRCIHAQKLCAPLARAIQQKTILKRQSAQQIPGKPRLIGNRLGIGKGAALIRAHQHPLLPRARTQQRAMIACQRRQRLLCAITGQNLAGRGQRRARHPALCVDGQQCGLFAREQQKDASIFSHAQASFAGFCHARAVQQHMPLRIHARDIHHTVCAANGKHDARIIGLGVQQRAILLNVDRVRIKRLRRLLCLGHNLLEYRLLFSGRRKIVQRRHALQPICQIGDIAAFFCSALHRAIFIEKDHIASRTICAPVRFFPVGIGRKPRFRRRQMHKMAVCFIQKREKPLPFSAQAHQKPHAVSTRGKRLAANHQTAIIPHQRIRHALI